MKVLNFNQKVTVLHSIKKTMVDKVDKREVVYFENIIICPELFEGAEKANSPTIMKNGEQQVVVTIRAAAETGDLKLRIAGQSTPGKQN